MAPKMYILVETDESQADSLSRAMSQFVNDLESKKSAPKNHANDDLGFQPGVSSVFHHADPPPPGMKNPDDLRIECPGEKTPPARTHNRVRSSPVEKPLYFDLGSLKPRQYHSASLTNNPPTTKSTITAETIIDAKGCAATKVSVSTDQCRKEYPGQQSNQCYNDSLPNNNIILSCGRRNGLDPTFRECRGMKKFQYLPLKPTIGPALSNSSNCANKMFALSDSSSTLASKPACFRSRQDSPVISGLRENCLKNIPRQRLIKYNSCINRNNGLQDRCDPVTKHAISKCCKLKN
ncbi:hypothetical protein TKK_0010902 [Trichogramma kaykai]